jgi:hypothetical protein
MKPGLCRDRPQVTLYLTENTVPLYYKDQPIVVGYCGNHKGYINTLCGKNAGFYIGKAGDTCSKNCAVKG